jgi:hypothetical protein
MACVETVVGVVVTGVVVVGVVVVVVAVVVVVVVVVDGEVGVEEPPQAPATTRPISAAAMWRCLMSSSCAMRLRAR